jgi:hypothetical protein
MTATMDASSYIGDVIMIEKDTLHSDLNLSCQVRVDDDVDDRIATLESEIASRQAELVRLKSTAVEKDSDESHIIVNNTGTAAAIEDTSADMVNPTQTLTMKTRVIILQ